MKFVHIRMLFLVWIVPIVFFVCYYGMTVRNRILTHYMAGDNLNVLAAGKSNNRRWLKNTLLLMAVLFLVIAIAGPQYGYKWQKIERKGVDLYIALDCSKSMLAEDIKPNRLERAKREVYDLISMLEGDRMGLVAFAGTAFVQCPLTLDYQAYHLFMSVLGPEYLPVGGTDIGAAITTAVEGFSNQNDSDKAIILITDGENTGNDPVAAAEEAKKKGIKIFCIGVGSEEGTPVPGNEGGFAKDENGKMVLSKLDETTLRKISEMTGGRYVRSVAGGMELETIYKQGIRGTMEQKTLESGKKKIWEERYQWVLGPSILCLIFFIGLPSVVTHRKENVT